VPLLRVWCDFNGCHADGTVRVDPMSQERNLTAEFQEGRRVLLWDGDLEVEGILHRVGDVWGATPLGDTRRDRLS